MSVARHLSSPSTVFITTTVDGPHYDEGGRFMHYCEHPGCDLWGSFGFGVSLWAGRLGRWFCAGHGEEFKQSLKAEKPKPAAERPSEPVRRTDAGGQGRLF